MIAPRLAEADRRRLLDVLLSARRRGFLGPADVEPHIDHALGFGACVTTEPELAVDLGTGGGLPGLPLALAWTESRWALVDSMDRRTGFLREVVSDLGLADRVRVLTVRAEQLGRDPAWRGRADVVVARSFGAPSVTAECAAPLLRVGGALVVSEPPESRPDRWPDALNRVGLQRERIGQYAVLRQVTPCPDEFPRRTGVPAKRPLW